MNVQSFQDFLQTGHIKGARGLKGELRVHLKDPDSLWLTSIKEVILVPRDKSSQIFHVKSFKKMGSEFVIQLDEVTERNGAESLRGALFFVSKKVFQSSPGEMIYLNEVMGFNVLDGLKTLGPVVGFDSNGVQDLLVVQIEGRQVLIPLIKAFLNKLDFEHRQIHMELPIGLTEMDLAL